MDDADVDVDVGADIESKTAASALKAVLGHQHLLSKMAEIGEDVKHIRSTVDRMRTDGGRAPAAAFLTKNEAMAKSVLHVLEAVVMQHVSGGGEPPAVDFVLQTSSSWTTICSKVMSLDPQIWTNVSLQDKIVLNARELTDAQLERAAETLAKSKEGLQVAVGEVLYRLKVAAMLLPSPQRVALFSLRNLLHDGSGLTVTGRGGVVRFDSSMDDIPPMLLSSASPDIRGMAIKVRAESVAATVLGSR